MNGLSKLVIASDFAAKKHKGQKRKGANREPYINHPIEVAKLLVVAGEVDDHDILVAAVLHDTVEDTETTEGEIGEKFGAKVASFVMEVTDDKRLPKTERKQLQIEHAPHLSDGAKQIKLADKISNIEDIVENPPESWSIERRIEYVEWGENVVAGLRGVNYQLEDLFDRVVERAKNSLLTER